MTVKTDKCVSCSNSLKFLGFIFSDKDIQPNPTMTDQILSITLPCFIKELASFPELVTYYNCFIKDFMELYTPLHEAQKHENKSFSWSDKYNKCFETLKHKLISVLVLQSFNMNKVYVITVDVSAKATGIVLSQEGHPVLCFQETKYNRDQIQQQ